MADMNEIYWLAGLLEGEGCFTLRSHHNPIIQLIMTDEDVVVRAAKLMECHKVVQCKMDPRGGKQLYRTTLYGITAVGLMNTLYPLMGERRKIQIKRCLEERRSYSRGAIIIWEKEKEVCFG